MAVKFQNGEAAKASLGSGVQVVNMFAEWCGPCKMLAPVLEEVSNSTEVIKVDLDQNQDFAREMGVTGVPTTFVYKDGELKDTIVGFVPLQEVQSRIAKVA